LTLVFRRKQTVIDQVTGGGDTVALRVPDHPVALQLLAALRHAAGETAGIAAPSANRFGEPPATSAQEVKDGLGSPGQCESAPDLILDAGECPRRVPSTIVSCVGAVPRLLRRGALSLEEIERVIGRHIDQ
jgi:L-threonylcarbamoyladenylate synthase